MDRHKKQYSLIADVGYGLVAGAVAIFVMEKISEYGYQHRAVVVFRTASGAPGGVRIHTQCINFWDSSHVDRSYNNLVKVRGSNRSV